MYSVVFHEDNEPSLTELRHWTNYLKKDILFIPHSKSNNISFSYNITQDFINFRLKVGDFEIKSEDVKFIWFNKGLLEFKIEKISSDLKNIDWYFKNEYEFAISNLYKIIEFISINTPPRYQLSKIESLMMARALGLQIPTTHVIQNKKELQEITEGNNNVFISKGLQEGISIKKRNKHYTTYTQLINHDLLSDLPEQFFPSLIPPQ
jgi:phage pi2 protein 07